VLCTYSHRPSEGMYRIYVPSMYVWYPPADVGCHVLRVVLLLLLWWYVVHMYTLSVCMVCTTCSRQHVVHACMLRMWCTTTPPCGTYSTYWCVVLRATGGMYSMYTLCVWYGVHVVCTTGAVGTTCLRVCTTTL
jgi:hypothetical protein